MTKQWFFASLIFADLEKHAGRRCNILLQATEPMDALAEARLSGSRMQSANSSFVGVEELLLVEGEVKDGVEVIWREETLARAAAVELFESAERQLRNGAETSVSASGWYAGEVLLVETLETLIPDENILIWRNTYLIAAPTPLAARGRLQGIGNLEEEVGNHQSDGIEAGWRFQGTLRMVALLEPPRDGSVLWSEELEGSVSELFALIPEQEELGLFRSLKRQP